MPSSSTQTNSSPTLQELPSWTFDPHRTEASFRGCRMGAPWVNGRFTDVHGKFYFDLEDPLTSSCVGEIDVANLYTGEPYLNTELRAADFLGEAGQRRITFAARLSGRSSESDFKAEVLLTMRGQTRRVPMNVAYLGQWEAPLWTDGHHMGSATRVGLRAEGLITGQDFADVTLVDRTRPARRNRPPANALEITLDIEAILDADLKAIGAIAF
jgi:polyisoprenoid-binding protein YceI